MKKVKAQSNIIGDDGEPAEVDFYPVKDKKTDTILDDPLPLIEHNKALMEQMRQEPEKAQKATMEIVGDDSTITLDTTAPEKPQPEKPEPKRGDADYDWSADYGTSDLYTHKFPNGIVVALKPFGDIFSKTWMYKIRNLKTNIDIELAAIDRGTCDAAKDVLESLEDDDDFDPIAELWTAWSKSATSNGDGDEGLTSGN